MAPTRTVRPPIDPALWARIVARDPVLDDTLVFAVRTTRIYCRPTCPARRPKPEHVTLYPDGGAARTDGYRACKRCRPDTTGPHDEEARFVNRIVDHLESRRGSPVTLADLGRHFRMEPSTLRRRFERVTGLTPHAYLETLRLRMIRQRLQRGDTVRDATYGSGFGSTGRTYTRVRERLGMTPGRYQKGGVGQRIRHATAASDLGWVLAARTDEGLASVQIGDDPDALLAALKEEFPRAEHAPAEDLGPILAEIVGRLAGHPPAQALPLDIQLTAFRTRVYEALLAIPRGETRTYQQVAAAIGAPGAARAVGSACAANPLAAVIPCHRVVRADGGMGGYRWGAGRKRRLLADERDAAEP